MSYQYITKYTSPNAGYDNFTYGHNIPLYIVVHHWGKDNQSFSGVLNWLCSPRAGASAHYILKDNTVACILNQSDCAWHTGNKWYNMHSIGIECRPEMTHGDLQTLAELIAQIWKDVGKELPVIGHKDIVATACPGRYYSKLTKIEEMARAIKNPSQKPLVPTNPTPAPRGEMYRVRTSWNNVSSQIGAFREKKNAIDLASSRKGYKVYDENGKEVWSKIPTIEKDVYNTNKPLTEKEAIMAGQAWSNRILGTSIKVDGIIGPDTKRNAIKVLQWALNKDYGAGLTIDGILGPNTRHALGEHYVRLGETQYLATAVEVLLLINGYNPHGVEIPGTIGDGCAKAIGIYQKDAGLVSDGSAGKNTILSLIDL